MAIITEHITSKVEDTKRSPSLDYLAAPYSDTDQKVVNERMAAFYLAVGQLTKRGHNIVSPLFFHPVVQLDKEVGSDWGYWKEYSHKLMAPCTRIIVLCLPGWTTSKGVMGEVEWARLQRKSIGFLEMNEKGNINPDIAW